ncbi:MAG: metabolite traffic protein EboE, partial [Chthoniobacterales bacterium]|nr:metabolite traffic protein EboE [Chthoniobacterales bacterium]
MRLRAGHHLAYSTNVHPGESWNETFCALEQHTLAVRAAIAPNEPFGIGLRLSDRASRELIKPATLARFRGWLEANECYVFTINGFPFGKFHGGPVKEQVFAPDWTTSERLEYTNRLFDILAVLLPNDVEGSVSTLPGSYKGFVTGDEQIEAIQRNFLRCVDHIAALFEKSGREMHLGVEPEPFGLFENTTETLRFFERLGNRQATNDRLARHLGVNYDACHFAVEYEDPGESLRAFRAAGIRISKLHLSSALRTASTRESSALLRPFVDHVYLHQVIARTTDGALRRYKDLPIALAENESAAEWRIHFHVPLYAELQKP